MNNNTNKKGRKKNRFEMEQDQKFGKQPTPTIYGGNGFRHGFGEQKKPCEEPVQTDPVIRSEADYLDRKNPRNYPPRNLTPYEREEFGMWQRRQRRRINPSVNKRAVEMALRRARGEAITEEDKLFLFKRNELQRQIAREYLRAKKINLKRKKGVQQSEKELCFLASEGSFV